MNEITREIIGHLTEQTRYDHGRRTTDNGFLRILNRSDIKTINDASADHDSGDDFLKKALTYFIDAVNNAGNPDEAWRAVVNNTGYGPEFADLDDFIFDTTNDFVSAELIWDDDIARLFYATRAWLMEENCEELLGGEPILHQMRICLFQVVLNFMWAIIEELKANAPWGVTDEEEK